MYRQSQVSKTGRIKHKIILQYILCYLLILTSGATLWTYVLEGVGFKAFIVLLIDVLIVKKYKIKIPHDFVIYSIITILMLMILTRYSDGGFFNGNDFKSTISFVIYALTGYVIYKIDENRAPFTYIHIVCFFALISIVFFSLQFVLGPGAFSELIFSNLNYRNEYGFLLYTINKSNMRNYGIFYEPGVYQAVLSVAIFLLLFNDILHLKEKDSRKYLTILTLAMLTTKSTTGYISIAIMYIISILKTNKSKKIKALFIFVLLVGGMALDYFINKNESLLYSVIIRKFAEIGYNNGRYRYGTSGGARVFLIDIALQILASNPWTGIGSNSYYINFLSGTVWENSGTGNILCITIAKRGILFTAFAIFFFLQRAFQNRKDMYSFAAYVLIFFNTVIAQSQLVYGVFAFLAFVESKVKYTNLVEIAK